MTTDLFVVPAPNGAEGFVELARTKTGRLFKKQILPEGSFVHPGDPHSKIQVNAELANKLKANFDAGYCDIVQVPVVNDANAHVEDPDRNMGEIVDVSYEKGKGVYVTLDARDKDRADKLGKTLLGASAMLHMNYTDTKTGKKVGPTLLHVAVTNRPYLTNLEEYQEIVAASADMSGEEAPVILQPAEQQEEPTKTQVVELTVEESSPMDLNELIQKLKDDHSIDLASLQSKAELADRNEALVAAMSQVLTTATGKEEPADDKLTVEDVSKAVVELAQEKVSLASELAEVKKAQEELRLTAATAEVGELVRAGRVLPHQQEVMVRLAMSDRPTFDALVPENPIVSLTEKGVTTHDRPAEESDPQVIEATQKAIDHYQEVALSVKPTSKK